ncbi:hypothetical protein G6F42_028659 [Rhizopus arrhizus]|nr:hypothetical protein G6F42_028659 [Rhizopus arrhizus]
MMPDKLVVQATKVVERGGSGAGEIIAHEITFVGCTDDDEETSLSSSTTSLSCSSSSDVDTTSAALSEAAVAAAITGEVATADVDDFRSPNFSITSSASIATLASRSE